MEAEEKQLDLNQLKVWLVELIEAVQSDLGVEKIDLSEDLYWGLDSKDKYNMSSVPDSKQLLVGQLYDDLDFLISGSAEKESLTRASLCHAIPLLNYLNYVVNEK
jgi:hypothetical protein